MFSILNRDKEIETDTNFVTIKLLITIINNNNILARFYFYLKSLS